MSRLVLAVGVSVLCSCGSDAALTVNGKVGGRTLVAAEAILVNEDLTVGGAAGTVAVVIISDKPGLCQALQDNAAIKSSAQLTMIAAVLGQGGLDAVVPGTYSIIPPAVGAGSVNLALASFDATNDSCVSVFTDSQDATAGTLELDSLAATAGGKSTGKLDLLFGSDRLVGNFEATYCDAGTSTAAPTCR